ncbi:hypothetical protein Cob_v000059 [Colletotrichum orbiculare MAFF 240422]|uniref:Uncharacterized protein n=1 Tax=Colletotrichum orbiculare (strain 104-T / ATCC 96160 / CBS 514.97 / LARS 414 / MAFF 240422) TaxID=1213857 RepID=A0A484G8I1_COLOR|nr:hypothetical protein Cob_v000059 [Colletotrichum orbiculare MAFF 240422]
MTDRLLAYYAEIRVSQQHKTKLALKDGSASGLCRDGRETLENSLIDRQSTMVFVEAATAYTQRLITAG